jgi:glycosyltransferase involved in cell wall biosynthesis
MNPSVSIVIPTRNAAVNLGQCLASLSAESVTFEVIVVDQQSSDGTRDVAVQAGATVLEVEPSAVYTPPARSRNAGAAVARGVYLLHLDADMAFARPWLAEAIELCENGEVAVVLEELDLATGYWAKCKALERRAYRNSPLEAARFVRTSVFHEAGGYDELIGSGEDWDIHARYAAQGSIGRVSGAVLHRLDSMSLGSQLRKKFGYGRSAAEFNAKHDGYGLPGAMLKAYAGSWRSFAADPAHAAGFVALRLGETAALTAGATYDHVLRRRRA